MLIRNHVLAAKVEGTPGTEEALAAEDAKFLVRNIKPIRDVRMQKRDVLRNSLATVPSIAGIKAGGFSFDLELRGSGTATTAPAWFTLARAAGHKSATAKSINIGAVTSGPFLHNETITGSGSSGTGRVIHDTANGAAAIKFETLTGSIGTGETITGGTSGATATTSSAATSIGVELYPTGVEDDIPTLSVGSYLDGRLEKYIGCRAKITALKLVNGEIGLASMEVLGAAVAPTDASILTGISHETTLPPVALGIALTIGSYSPILKTVSLDYGTGLELRENISRNSGIEGSVITTFEPMLTLDPESKLFATYNPIADQWASTERIIDFTHGSSAGNRFRYYLPKCQPVEVSQEERGLYSVDAVRYQVNGPSLTDEKFISILHY